MIILFQKVELDRIKRLSRATDL
ncbi:hypothetical protein RSAG8_04191, partial [Rhizoctonia solani AG-8 WAC10335]